MGGDGNAVATFFREYSPEMFGSFIFSSYLCGVNLEVFKFEL